MPTSELSNALNPYVSQSRFRNPSSNHIESTTPVSQSPQGYVPHRSELELAISEPIPPPPPPPLPPITTVRPRQPTPGNIQAVQELVRIVAATRESQEIERKRRLAWEQEQEAKYTQRQAEMERQMLEMRQELTSLRSIVNMTPSPSSGLFTPQYNMSPALAVQRPPQPASPISPVSQPSYPHPMFVQGSSSQPLPSHHSAYSDSARSFSLRQSEPPVVAGESQLPSVTPAPSPQLTSLQPIQLRGETLGPRVNQRKRQASYLSSEEDGGSSSDSSTSNKVRPLKRTSHHDRRCLTIHHALREHIVRLMELDNDRELPDSHSEGTPLGAEDPVRFVWDKTAKQSAHNHRMKTRILEDIKSNRRLYKHVPDKDFGKKVLDSAFDQSFITFRNKFRAQRDAGVAQTYKKREDHKAQKARHLSRRKIKLTNRADSRMKIDPFKHVIFDGALQLECMSSEESDVDSGPVPSSARSPGMLRTRGYLWRSTRLTRFYCILDDEEKADKSAKPKRGIGKKERCTGPPKDGFYLPPKGVATWMISRQWIKSYEGDYPDLLNVLEKLIDDPPGFDWDRFDLLGEESDDSADELQTTHGQQFLPAPHHSTSSLNYALV